MAYQIILGKDAVREINEIMDWYANTSVQATENFYKSFVEKSLQIFDHPTAFSLVRPRPNYRKAKIRRFPYYIVYRINEQRGRIFVAAVVHVKRNPGSWVKNLK